VFPFIPRLLTRHAARRLLLRRRVDRGRNGVRRRQRPWRRAKLPEISASGNRQRAVAKLGRSSKSVAKAFSKTLSRCRPCKSGHATRTGLLGAMQQSTLPTALQRQRGVWPGMQSAWLWWCTGRHLSSMSRDGGMSELLMRRRFTAPADAAARQPLAPCWRHLHVVGALPSTLHLHCNGLGSEPPCSSKQQHHRSSLSPVWLVCQRWPGRQHQQRLVTKAAPLVVPPALAFSSGVSHTPDVEQGPTLKVERPLPPRCRCC
jgi:hypothetical protein